MEAVWFFIPEADLSFLPTWTVENVGIFSAGKFLINFVGKV